MTDKEYLETSINKFFDLLQEFVKKENLSFEGLKNVVSIALLGIEIEAKKYDLKNKE